MITNSFSVDFVSFSLKNIPHIEYNFLNLPTKILWQNGTYITYTYNATGQKIEKQVQETKNKTTTIYLDGYQYKDGLLQFFPMAEGYVNVLNKEEDDGGSFKHLFDYVYNYTDHLGNIRLSYTDANRDGKIGNYIDFSNGYQQVKEILEENNYYPFGLKHKNYNSLISKYALTTSSRKPVAALNSETGYKYKYNGKELQDELGLNWYAMDARMYDPAIARWVVIDPVIHPEMSPYNAFNNSPVFWSDPSGEEVTEDENGITFTGADAKAAFAYLQSSLGEGGDDNTNEECCKNFFNKIKKLWNDGVDRTYGYYYDMLEMDENVDTWHGEDGFYYAIIHHSESVSSFYRITSDWLENVDELPPMGIRPIEVGFPAGKALKGSAIILAGARGSTRSTMIYLAKEGKKVIYVGITNNFAVRAATHLRKKGIFIEKIPGLSDLSRADARAVEQVLIEAYGLGGKLGQTGQLLNRINSISSKNKVYKESVKRGYELLKKVGVEL